MYHDGPCLAMNFSNFTLGQFAESRGEISFPEIPSIIMEKLIQYLYYKVRYTNATYRIPEFKVEPEIALELLIASGYLDC